MHNVYTFHSGQWSNGVSEGGPAARARLSVVRVRLRRISTKTLALDLHSPHIYCLDLASLGLLAMPANITATSSSDWKYISEGGSSIVFSYIGTADEFTGTALRLRKIENKLPYTEYTDGEQELDDPTISFQHRIIEKLVPSVYLPRLETVETDREWLELLAKQSEEKRPLERRAKDRIDAGRRKAVLATDLVGGLGWAVEIKVRLGAS